MFIIYYIIPPCDCQGGNEEMKRYFYRLPAEVMEEHGHTVAVVYSVLLDACQEGVFRANLKVETIMKKCKMSKQTVISTINKLVEIGLIKRAKEGRRTVYDVVPVLPPKERNKGYVPETYRVYGDTYEELLKNIPDPTIREHYKKQMELLGFPMDEVALFDLRTISVLAASKKKELPFDEAYPWTENTPEDKTAEERISKTGHLTKFNEYDEDEQAEFNGQLFFDDI